MSAKPISAKLSHFRDDELYAEIARRRRTEDYEQPPFKSCDQCDHFVALSFGIDQDWPLPNPYNPCDLGHKMSFHVPLDYSDAMSGEWGFYRRDCRNRIEIANAEP